MKSENKKTKILAVGDIHGDTGLVEKLAEKAEKENVDVVILAGDLTFLEESTKNLIGPFVKKGKEVFIIPGNHESNITTDYLATKYSVKNLHGYSFKKNNLGFFGAGGVMLIVQLGFENPWPATIGFVLFIIGIRIKIHMG